MTVAERLGYAVRTAAASLRPGDWTGYAPLQGDGPATAVLQGPRLQDRLLQVPRVFRAALEAAREVE